MRVLSIFGTRPEAVKMGPVVRALEHHEQIESYVCVTAQHRQMLDQVLDLFDIQPDIDLDLMRPNQSLAELTANIFSHLDPVIAKINPDWILVQGDTTTAMVAGMAAFYRRIRLGHVEAGLRTFDKWQPFPEEVNRRMISVVSDLNFAPTEYNRQNLLREGVSDGHICVTGNPAVDALQTIGSHPVPPETSALLERLGIQSNARTLILITAHRRENFGKPIEDICGALKRLAHCYQEQVQIIYPVHLNPNVQEPVHRLLDGIENISLLEPLDYLPMVHLMRHARLILTDSGGIQEEATALQIPALVLRETTERPEGVDAGVLKLVGTNPDVIVAETSRLLDDASAYAAMSGAQNPFGDGHAAERIVEALLAFENQVDSKRG